MFLEIPLLLVFIGAINLNERIFFLLFSTVLDSHTNIKYNKYSKLDPHSLSLSTFVYILYLLTSRFIFIHKHNHQKEFFVVVHSIESVLVGEFF